MAVVGRKGIVMCFDTMTEKTNYSLFSSVIVSAASPTVIQCQEVSNILQERNVCMMKFPDLLAQPM